MLTAARQTAVRGGGATQLRFYVATHRDGTLPGDNPLFVPIGCGGYRPDHPLAVTDDSGGNISAKNRHYSELTGWYWIWKNVHDLEVVGLCHYRRYFFLHPGHPLFHHDKLACDPNDENIAFFTHPAVAGVVADALAAADLIVPRRVDLGESIADHYRRYHVAEDWDLFHEAVKAVHPDLYRHVDVFRRARHAHMWNMMIAPKRAFDAYMAVLFPVMEWMERVRPFRQEPYQCRVPAFLAERFFTLYLHATAPRCVEMPVAYARGR